ncbi:MAG: hypothetical protein J7K88_12455 [Candidatus Fermentibacteraceae bacterium]|nr:hypothetical protein [Candidatus Fermentibacteraceae bacterium]
MDRREFLEKAGKAGGALLLSSIAGKAVAGEMEQSSAELWSNGLFLQDCVDVSGEAQGMVRARVDGVWGDYSTSDLPDEFLEWNLSARIDVLDNIMGMMTGQGGEPPSLAGPHNAAMATRGSRRNDSILSINNAFKGMGLCPRREIIADKIAFLRENSDAPMPAKIDFLKDMYSDPANFDLTKLISLELYSTPTFETHTFINLMKEPVTSLVFLDNKSYEVRGIGQLVDPEDTSCGEYATRIVEYTNLAHSFFHGEFPRLFPGILVHVLETFDNTPGTGRGVLVRV